MSTDPSQFPETDHLHYGPCVHCGHLRDEHGEREVCLRAGFYGNHYGCCAVEHDRTTPPGQQRGGETDV